MCVVRSPSYPEFFNLGITVKEKGSRIGHLFSNEYLQPLISLLDQNKLFGLSHMCQPVESVHSRSPARASHP